MGYSYYLPSDWLVLFQRHWRTNKRGGWNFKVWLSRYSPDHVELMAFIPKYTFCQQRVDQLYSPLHEAMSPNFFTFYGHKQENYGLGNEMAAPEPELETEMDLPDDMNLDGEESGGEGEEKGGADEEEESGGEEEGGV